MESIKSRSPKIKMATDDSNVFLKNDLALIDDVQRVSNRIQVEITGIIDPYTQISKRACQAYTHTL